MRDMDWKILNELYHFHNITKAAAALYITQPALTKRLQAMEQEFGVQIVLRGKQGIIFTSAGEYLAKCAQKQIQFMDEIRYKLDYLQNEQQGTLILGTSYSFSKTQLPDIIKEYKKLFPNVELELICMKSDRLAHMAGSGQVHGAFVRGQYDVDAQQVKIHEERGFILSKEPVEMEKLPELERIGYDSSTYTKNIIDKWWREHFDKPPHIVMSTAIFDSVWTMVHQGLGYAISFLEEEQEKKMDLWKYPMENLDGSPVIRTTYFLYKDLENQPDYVKAFIHMIQNGD